MTQNLYFYFTMRNTFIMFDYKEFFEMDYQNSDVWLRTKLIWHVKKRREY
jgi:hypothetical protein